VTRYASVVLLAACGGTTEVPLERWGTSAADALCSWAVRCRHVPDTATCERLLDLRAYDVRPALDAVAAGVLAYNIDQGTRCVTSVAEAVCPAEPFSDPSCYRMFTGLVATGGACNSHFECAGNASCDDVSCDERCCYGTCGTPTAPPEDPPPLARIGEGCATHSDCVADAYCETDGTCTALPDEEGERCLYGCLWGDLRCDVETLTCVKWDALGEPCGNCDPAYAYCDVVCRLRPGDGEACDAARRCIASATCEDGTCRARGTAGDPCSLDGHCDVECDETAGMCMTYESCH
jgi:hypothetical protein